jgi:uracil-DNA glycosylase family 4
MSEALARINNSVVNCNLCPRLSQYIEEVSEIKVKRFREQLYWAKPLPSFGDPNAKLLILGLAPAAHGGNRTGRMFTGDSSGTWVARALYETGFANIGTSDSINDGLILNDAYITAAVRCAPPGNLPTRSELSNCSRFLLQELDVLNSNLKIIVALGKIAFDAYCNCENLKKLKFVHGAYFSVDKGKILLASYHPSRQNTNTGRLTWNMWIKIFRFARQVIDNAKM